MLVETPDRSLEQRLTALAEANRIRMWRAELKRDMKAGRADVAGLLAAPPAELGTMKVYDLLRAMPKVGVVKTRKVLRRLAIAPSKTVGGLSPRQRQELLGYLRIA